MACHQFGHGQGCAASQWQQSTMGFGGYQNSVKSEETNAFDPVRAKSGGASVKPMAWGNSHRHIGANMYTACGLPRVL